MNTFKHCAMEEIIGRIREYMTLKKLTGSSLAKELNMSSVSVNQWLSGKRKPSWEFISAILNLDKSISSEWLTRGEGVMMKEDSNESSCSEMKELSEMKVKMLVQEGVIKELRAIILEKNNKKGGC